MRQVNPESIEKEKIQEMTREEFNLATTATVIGVLGILPWDVYVEIENADTHQIYGFTNGTVCNEIEFLERYDEQDVLFAPVIKLFYVTSRKVKITIRLDEE